MYTHTVGDEEKKESTNNAPTEPAPETKKEKKKDDKKKSDAQDAQDKAGKNPGRLPTLPKVCVCVCARVYVCPCV